MQAIQPILLGLGMLLSDGSSGPGKPDLAHLQEMLHDRQQPQGQSQAALLLLESKRDGAARIIHDSLRRVEDADLFLPLAAAVRLRQDRRFPDELFAALSSNRPAIREAAAQALAVTADVSMVTRLDKLAANSDADTSVRQIALWTLGRCGTRPAARALLDHLKDNNETLRRAAVSALRDLSGQDYGLDPARWQDWWDQHKHMTRERWLESRLAFQTSRAHRLEGDLTRSRAQLLRLHQQLYGRLSGGERVTYIQSLIEQDDPAVRSLAVNWSVELLAGAEDAQQQLLTKVLLRLSHDSSPEVQRNAVLGLGRIHAPAVFERLEQLAQAGAPATRTAAMHALALHVRGGEQGGPARRKQVMPLLQKALDDPALEVVVEAAEDLGALGALEAGPVLTGLLRHTSEPVRQAAAQALERVAEPSVLSGLLDGLDDPCATVRFNLVGALAHAAGDGSDLSMERRKRLLGRLDELLLRDSDPGVRSRAATMLGECGTPAQLASLWRCVLSGEDARVQEKAWGAFVDILARAGQVSLLQEWDRTLTAARQGPRRLRMLTDIVARWQSRPERKEAVIPAREILVQAQLELGKWSSAAPMLRELLARPAGEADTNRRLSWLLTAGQQALNEGNHVEALRMVESARPFLPPMGKLTDAFEKLEKEAAPKE